MSIDSEKTIMMAALVGCKFFKFPLKYLGVPLSDAKLKVVDWQGIIDKVQDKISN
jgi:hypothetical protein